MANPEIESELDGIDRLSVCLYRLGLSLTALLLLCRGVGLLVGPVPLSPAVWLTMLVVASGLCGFCLHIYDKRVRFLLQGLAWGGLILAACGAPALLVLGAALATLSGDDSQQGSWDQQVSLSSQVLTGKAQQALTYEHLARNGKNTVLTGGVKDARVQQMVDKALGFDRKKFDDLESQIKGVADNKALSAEERETQTWALTEQRDAMLKAAMDRLTGKSSSGQSAQA